MEPSSSVIETGPLNADSPEISRCKSYTEIQLADELVQTLRMYLIARWKDTEALFPSRQSDRIDTDSVRILVKQAVVDAEVQPFTTNDRGCLKDMTPHTL